MMIENLVPVFVLQSIVSSAVWLLTTWLRRILAKCRSWNCATIIVKAQSEVIDVSHILHTDWLIVVLIKGLMISVPVHVCDSRLLTATSPLLHIVRLLVCYRYGICLGTDMERTDLGTLMGWSVGPCLLSNVYLYAVGSVPCLIHDLLFLPISTTESRVS